MKRMKRLFLFAFIFIIILLVSAFAKETITVSCYIDDPSDNNEIGDIEVFNVNVAAQECNGAFEDCVGDCTGCYLDSESLEMCIDSSGDRFERE